MRSTLQSMLRPLAFGALAVSAAGCAGSPAALSSASSSARGITDLFFTVFWIAVAIFVITEGILVFTVIRFRRRHAGETPDQVHGNNRLELAWTIAPALIVAVIFALTVRTMYAVTEVPTGAMEVKVIGHQWWWEFQYPEQGIITSDELHIPAGRAVNLTIESTDVIHSFWIPQLAGKTDAVPGHQNKTWIRADQPGVFLGQCAEFCGVEHADMRMRVIAEPTAQFEAWIKQMQTPPAASTGNAAQGRAVLERSACIGCHTIDGTKAQGKVGPNLTHIGSHTTLAGGIMDNTADNLTRWLKDPQAVKPGNGMPNLHLSDADIAALVAYLQSLK